MVLHSDVELRCDVCDYVTKKQHLLKRHLLTQVKLSNFILYISFVCYISLKIIFISIPISSHLNVKYVKNHLKLNVH